MPPKSWGPGATPRPPPNPHLRPLWNNPKTYDPSDRKTRPQFGQSPKITRSQSGKTVRHQFGPQQEGTLRAVKNLCVGALIEAVRDQTKTVDLKQVNAVLMQPHWRHNTRDEPAQPLVANNQKTKPK